MSKIQKQPFIQFKQPNQGQTTPQKNSVNGSPNLLTSGNGHPITMSLSSIEGGEEGGGNNLGLGHKPITQAVSTLNEEEGGSNVSPGPKRMPPIIESSTVTLHPNPSTSNPIRAISMVMWIGPDGKVHSEAG